MFYRTLGKTEMQVSAVGFGGIPIQRVDAAEVRGMLEKAVELGVNFIDTARGYTVSEEYLGAALEGIRDKFYLATKSMSRGYEDMKRDIDISLKNLRTDHIDLYQLHNIGKEADFKLAFSDEGATRALKEAKAAGKILHIGGTTHTKEGFAELLQHSEIESIMFPYNIVESQGEDLMAEAKDKNVGFIAMKPLAGGNIEDGRLAVRYILQNENCTLAIPGIGSVEQLVQDASAAADKTPLTEEENAAVAEVRKTLSGDFCRRCGYCAPCTVGIDIPGIFTMQGYLNKYGLEGWARGRYESAPVKASACVECGLCESRCPYNLPIREKLKQVAKDFEG